MTAEITTEKARIGAPSIAGFTEEGEGLVAAKVDHSHNHGVTVMSSRAERLTSFNVADFPLPTGREEEWRFSPVRALANLLSDTATDLEPVPAADFTVEAPEGYVRGTLAPVPRPAEPSWSRPTGPPPSRPPTRTRHCTWSSRLKPSRPSRCGSWSTAQPQAAARTHTMCWKRAPTRAAL